VKKGRGGRCLSILSPALWLEFGVADLIYVSFFTPRAGRLAIAKGAPDALSTSISCPYIYVGIPESGWLRVGFYVPINMQNLCGCCCRFPGLAAQKITKTQSKTTKSWLSLHG